MSLNNIEISDFIIGEWYRDTLLPLPGGPAKAAAPSHTPPPSPPSQITPPAAPQATPPIIPAPFKYHGKNRRNITLLEHYPDTAFLTDTHLAFRTKILEACRMTIADVAIVNHAAAAITITSNT